MIATGFVKYILRYANWSCTICKGKSPGTECLFTFLKKAGIISFWFPQVPYSKSLAPNKTLLLAQSIQYSLMVAGNEGHF